MSVYEVISNAPKKNYYTLCFPGESEKKYFETPALREGTKSPVPESIQAGFDKPIEERGRHFHSGFQLRMSLGGAEKFMAG